MDGELKASATPLTYHARLGATGHNRILSQGDSYGCTRITNEKSSRSGIT
jgi:hypothetical protein